MKPQNISSAIGTKSMARLSPVDCAPWAFGTSLPAPASRGQENVEGQASHERCSLRHINMTLSLAFLSPALTKAAVEGRLPLGIGLEQLRELPLEWDRQFEALGLSPI